MFISVCKLNSQYNYSFQVKYGFIIPHRQFITYLINEHVYSFEFRISKFFCNPNKFWHCLYNYPEGGIGFYFSNLGNNKISGFAFAGFSFLNFNLYKKKLFLPLSLGVSYITKSFDYKKNYYNLVISSHINVFFSIGILYKVNFYKNNIFFGPFFVHFSNGSVYKPNLGFNIFYLSFMFKYNTKEVLDYPKCNKLNPYNEITISNFIGVRQNYPETPNFLVYTFSASLNKTKNQKVKYGLGTDIFYDPSVVPRAQTISDYSKIYHYFRTGIKFNLLLCIQNIELVFNTGVYYYDKYLLDGRIYSRVGVNFIFNKNLQFNIWLKSHFFRADVIECGMTKFFRKE